VSRTIVFMGTSDFAVPALEAVRRLPYELVAVVTRPDRPSGRGQKLRASPVGAHAAHADLRVMKPDNVNAEGSIAELRALGPDLIVVVAFGAILGPELLALPRLGCLNLHGSLLPRYRGAAPIARALWDGCVVTGVTTIWMDEGIDTGDMALQRAVPVAPEDDAGALGARLAEAGAALLAETVALAAQGNAPRYPQPLEGVSYARKLTRAHGEVEWSLDAVTVWNRQRAMTPRPGAFSTWRGKHLLIEQAEVWHLLATGAAPGAFLGLAPGRGALFTCKPGALLVKKVKPQDHRSMSAEEWARGARLAAGERLGAAQPEPLP
jgi:methionyl-tRNA formyltransferase